MPRDKERFQSFSGTVIDKYVPSPELHPIYSLNNRTFGRREPADWVAGHQMGAEMNVVLNFWDIDKLEGQIIVCPVGNRDRELLHKFIEYAYKIEEAVERGRDQLSLLKTVWKKLVP